MGSWFSPSSTTLPMPSETQAPVPSNSNARAAAASAGAGETNSLGGQQLVSGEGICVLSKQQPQCPVAASSLINQPQPNVLGFPPPQGDWGWARVPRGVRWGWVGGGVGGRLAPHLLASVPSLLSWKLSALPVAERLSPGPHHCEGISYKSPVGVCWGRRGEEG